MFKILKHKGILLLLFLIIIFVVVITIYTYKSSLKENFDADVDALEKKVLLAVNNPLDFANTTVNNLGSKLNNFSVDQPLNTLFNRIKTTLQIDNIFNDTDSSERWWVQNTSTLMSSPSCPRPPAPPINPIASGPAPQVQNCESAMGQLYYVDELVTTKNGNKTIIVTYDTKFINTAQPGYVIFGSNIPSGTTIVDFSAGMSESGKVMAIYIDLSQAITKVMKNQKFCWQPPAVDCVVTYPDPSWANTKCVANCPAATTSAQTALGVQTQTGTVTTQPQWGGASCPSLTITKSGCSVNCPVNCSQPNAWTNSGNCSKTCGGGQQLQTRLPPIPAQNGGTCSAEDLATTKYVDCNLQACFTPCIVGNTWTAIGTCTGPCGTNNGTQTVQQNIIQLASDGTCRNQQTKQQPCTASECSIDADCVLGNTKIYQGKCTPVNGVSCGTTGTIGYTLNVVSPASGNGTCNNPVQYDNSCSLPACPTIPGGKGACCDVLSQYVPGTTNRVCLDFAIDNKNPEPGDWITCTPVQNYSNFEYLNWYYFIWSINGQRISVMYGPDGTEWTNGILRPTQAGDSPSARFQVFNAGANTISCSLVGRGFDNCPNGQITVSYNINVGEKYVAPVPLKTTSCCNIINQYPGNIVDGVKTGTNINVCISFTVDNSNINSGGFVTCTPITDIFKYDSTDWYYFLWSLNGKPVQLYTSNDSDDPIQASEGIIRPGQGNPYLPAVKIQIPNKGTNVVTCSLYGRGFTACGNHIDYSLNILAS